MQSEESLLKVIFVIIYRLAYRLAQSWGGGNTLYSSLQQLQMCAVHPLFAVQKSV